MKDTLLINISLDGDRWCAQIGDNLQDGLAGFGGSPTQAIRELTDEIERWGWNLDKITL